MKTEDELLDLIAEAHTYGDVRYIKDYLAKDVIYDSVGRRSIIGKENICTELETRFHYNKTFNIKMDVIKYAAQGETMGYVSFEEDVQRRVLICIVIESEDGLITKYYEVKLNYTRRTAFQNLKEIFFEPRAIRVSEQYKTEKL